MVAGPFRSLEDVEQCLDLCRIGSFQPCLYLAVIRVTFVDLAEAD
jgi:hypothetical protein